LVFFSCAGVPNHKARHKCAAYAASKAALFSFARSLALQEAPHGLRVNTISPGLIPHDGAHSSSTDPALQQAVPLGRVGTLDEVAHAALWLSSPGASYAIGVDLAISGGWLG
jgi:meso-butanediol dehydrogenase/(S,S)-butanediol dehydrogenase/diacetyl reductase